jgi:hypothetical protein
MHGQPNIKKEKKTFDRWGRRVFTMKQVPQKHWYTSAKIYEVTSQKIDKEHLENLKCHVLFKFWVKINDDLYLRNGMSG